MKTAAAMLLGLLPSDRAWPQNDPCTNAAGYVTPPGVELSAEGDAGVAPAEAAPSAIAQALPDSYRFPLAVDPLPSRLPNASIDLGEVAIDGKTGQATLDGVPLSSTAQADAQAGCRSAPKGR